MKLPVGGYLAAVLSGLADVPIQRLPERTPIALPPTLATQGRIPHSSAGYFLCC
jgi:hypothetical protein